MNKYKYSLWLVPMIMIVGIITCLSFGFLTEVKFITSVLFLITGCFFTWKTPKLGVRIIAFCLVLAVFEVLMYFNITYGISFGFKDSFALSIEVIAFFLLGVHIYLNKEYFQLKKTEVTDFRKVEKRKNQYNSKVSAFKWRFRDKSKAELKSKISNTELVVEARQAARELLEKLEAEDFSI